MFTINVDNIPKAPYILNSEMLASINAIVSRPYAADLPYIAYTTFSNPKGIYAIDIATDTGGVGTPYSDVSQILDVSAYEANISGYRDFKLISNNFVLYVDIPSKDTMLQRLNYYKSNFIDLTNHTLVTMDNSQFGFSHIFTNNNTFFEYIESLINDEYIWIANPLSGENYLRGGFIVPYYNPNDEYPRGGIARGGLFVLGDFSIEGQTNIFSNALVNMGIVIAGMVTGKANFRNSASYAMSNGIQTAYNSYKRVGSAFGAIGLISFGLSDDNTTSKLRPLRDFGYFISKKLLIGRLNLLGIPWTFDINQAINSPVSEFPDYNPIDVDNPLSPGGSSTTGGGNGTFDDTSEPVDFAPLPSLTALNSGFVGLYAPTLSQLQGLSNYLWNENFNLDQLKKLFADPMDLLISLTIVPLNPPVTTQENIKVGFISTGLPMNKVEKQFISYDFGSLEIKPYFDSALDFSPFTKISIYLPYIGLRQLNVDEIMGQTIHLQYNIDLFTGSCVAEIKVANSVLYTFNGNLASSIPLTAGNFSNFLSATMNVAATIGLAATTGGAVGATSIASATANLISSAKPNIEHTGSISSTTGYLSNKVPYLVYEIPRQSLPHKYQDYVGYPSNITSKLSDLKGYTEIESIHLENIPATTQELTEIESLLKQGVIL